MHLHIILGDIKFPFPVMEQKNKSHQMMNYDLLTFSAFLQSFYVPSYRSIFFQFDLFHLFYQFWQLLLIFGQFYIFVNKLPFPLMATKQNINLVK